MTTAVTAPSTTTRLGKLGLFALLAATFMGQVDMFIVNIVLPSIQHALHAEFGQAQFVVDGYILACGAGLVIGSRLGDRIGRKRVFLSGVALFTVTSLCCGLAVDPGQLIAFRFLQGAAESAMIPQVLSIMRATIEDEERRGRAVGAYGVAIGLGVIAGLAEGGLLVHLDIGGIGWRSVFLVNVPLGLAVLVGGWRGILENRASHGPGLDPAGSALIGVGLPALLVTVIFGPADGLTWWTIGCAVVALLVGVLLPIQQRRLAQRGGDPVFPSEVLARPGFRLTLVTMVVFFAGNSGLFLIFTYYLQDGLGAGTLVAGLMFVPLGVAYAIGSFISLRLARRLRPFVAVGGCALLAVGMLSLAAATTAAMVAQPFMLALGIGICGFAQGLVVAPLVAALLSRVLPDQAGAASGIAATMTQLGFALGVGVPGTVYRMLADAHHRLTTPDRQALAFSTTVIVLVCFAGTACLLNWRLRRLAA